MPDSEPKTYSVSVRVKRTTVEYAYVSVLVASEIMKTDGLGNVVQDEKGFARIDPQKMVLRAEELARQSSVRWYRESVQIEPHPVQKAPEANEMPST